MQLLFKKPRRSINDTTYGQQQQHHHLLQYIDLEARIAVLDRSITMTGSKRGIPPSLKKFGSATTNPRVETSIVWTRTLRFLNSLALVASILEYFWSLRSLECCMLVS